MAGSVQEGVRVFLKTQAHRELLSEWYLQGREKDMRQEGNDCCPWESSVDEILKQHPGSFTFDKQSVRRRWLILRQSSLHTLLDLTKGWQLAHCRETCHN